ncbi:MAG: hypothetical protein EU541_02595 [Promethearchaeota archaeon]|nr:MAG: hypothetical protein EU541_02595 [Candidatus Lokiarchaeota archaeon]
MSQSSMNIFIKIQLYGIGALKAKIMRHLAPITIDKFLQKLPLVLRGRFSFKSKKYWTLPGVEIFKGLNESAISDLEKGDIVYNPKTDEILIILEDQNFPNKVNKMGEVVSDLSPILKARNGLSTKISQLQTVKSS